MNTRCNGRVIGIGAALCICAWGNQIDAAESALDQPPMKSSFEDVQGYVRTAVESLGSSARQAVVDMLDNPSAEELLARELHGALSKTEKLDRLRRLIHEWQEGELPVKPSARDILEDSATYWTFIGKAKPRNPSERSEQEEILRLERGLFAAIHEIMSSMWETLSPREKFEIGREIGGSDFATAFTMKRMKELIQDSAAKFYTAVELIKQKDLGKQGARDKALEKPKSLSEGLKESEMLFEKSFGPTLLLVLQALGEEADGVLWKRFSPYVDPRTASAATKKLYPKQLAQYEAVAAAMKSLREPTFEALQILMKHRMQESQKPKAALEAAVDMLASILGPVASAAGKQVAGMLRKR